MPAKGQYDPNAKPDSIRQRKYQGNENQKKRRAQRNAARRAAERIHGKKKLKGKEVDHPNSPKKGSLNNARTRIISKKLNRKLGGEKSHTGNSRK
jgi:hypothetical protein